jgi:hypothetical protein
MAVTGHAVRNPLECPYIDRIPTDAASHNTMRDGEGARGLAALGDFRAVDPQRAVPLAVTFETCAVRTFRYEAAVSGGRGISWRRRNPS